MDVIFVCFQSDKIYTVIKTSPMWRDVTGTREAVFKVNQKAHLLSLITMVGPSPDWCIGEWSELDINLNHIRFGVQHSRSACDVFWPR